MTENATPGQHLPTQVVQELAFDAEKSPSPRSKFIVPRVVSRELSWSEILDRVRAGFKPQAKSTTAPCIANPANKPSSVVKLPVSDIEQCTQDSPACGIQEAFDMLDALECIQDADPVEVNIAVDETSVVKRDKSCQAMDACEKGSPLRRANMSNHSLFSSVRSLKSHTKHGAEEYEFMESMWDVSLFVFSDFMPAASSLLILFLGFANLAMQILLCLLINDHFATQQISSNTVRDLFNWRITVAHDLKFMDVVTHQSLAHRVCESSDGLFMSGVPAGHLQKVNNYRPRSGQDEARFLPVILPQFENQGIVMCVICLVIWWLTLTREGLQIKGMAEALWMLPSHDGYSDDVTVADDKFQILSMKRGRRAWCFANICVRTLVFLSLGLTGTLFLLFTLDLRELLFNCAALEIVINLDELLFAALTPKITRKLMSALMPLPLPKRKYARGMDLLAVSISLVTLLLATVAVPLFIDVNVAEHLTCAREAMCGGQLNFLITMDPAGAVTASAGGGSHGNVHEPLSQHCIQKYMLQDQLKAYRSRAVLELITDATALTANVESSLSDIAAPLEWGYLSLQSRSTIPIGERMNDLNPHCTDFDVGRTVWPRSFLTEMLRDATGLPSAIFTCAAAKAQCGQESEAGVRLRQWCPDTCGCTQPNSSLSLPSPAYGCPPSCSAKSTYTKILNATRCEDASRNSLAFQNYIIGLQSVMTSYEGSWASKFSEWSKNLSNQGCQYHDLGGFGDLCNANVFKLKPLMHVCPVTCGCKRNAKPPEGQPPLCPTSCIAS